MVIQTRAVQLHDCEWLENSYRFFSQYLILEYLRLNKILISIRVFWYIEGARLHSFAINSPTNTGEKYFLTIDNHSKFCEVHFFSERRVIRVEILNFFLKQNTEPKNMCVVSLYIAVKMLQFWQIQHHLIFPFWMKLLKDQIKLSGKSSSSDIWHKTSQNLLGLGVQTTASLKKTG